MLRRYCRLMIVIIIALITMIYLGQFALEFANEIASNQLGQETQPKNLTHPIPFADFIQFQIQTAERNWERERIKKSAHKLQTLRIWNYFAPTFTCPLTLERLGRLGDGGKWVCGFSQYIATKPDCLVYSFGIGYETTFERDILERSNCTIRMFDPTIYKPRALLSAFPGRVFWHNIGISASDSSIINFWKTGSFIKTGKLKTLMKKFGDNSKNLDILKMDVEGAEWDSVSQILKDFPSVLPFAQFLFEIHLQHSYSQNFKIFRKWWNKLEAHGLRPFSIELNYGSNLYRYSEFGMLNIKMEPFKLKN